MNPTFQVINSIGNVLTINNEVQKLSTSYLRKNHLIGNTTLEVDNTEAFASSGILLIHVRDSENAEFVQYSAVPTQQTITCSPLLLPHSRGENVSSVLWNQFIIESSPDGTTWSAVSTVDIDPTATFTRLVDTAVAGTYYRVAFRNSVTGAQSPFSDIIQSVAPDANSAQGLINQVITEFGINPNDTIITQEFLLSALNEARLLFDNINYGAHWDWRQQFNKPFKLLAGTNNVPLPANIDFTETNRSLLALRLNGYNNGYTFNVQYVDKKLWNDITLINQGSVLAQQANIGDTTLVLENSGDFGPLGSVYIATSDYSQSIITTSFTANNSSTNTLSGIPVTAIDRVLPVGTQVWARITGTAYPTAYTVHTGKIWFNQVIPMLFQGRNAYMDYYEKLLTITDTSYILPEHHSHIYKSYIKYAIEKRKDPSTPTTHPDYQLFELQAKAIGQNMFDGQPTRIRTS